MRGEFAIAECQASLLSKKGSQRSKWGEGVYGGVIDPDLFVSLFFSFSSFPCLFACFCSLSKAFKGSALRKILVFSLWDDPVFFFPERSNGGSGETLRRGNSLSRSVFTLTLQSLLFGKKKDPPAKSKDFPLCRALEILGKESKNAQKNKENPQKRKTRKENEKKKKQVPRLFWDYFQDIV